MLHKNRLGYYRHAIMSNGPYFSPLYGESPIYGYRWEYLGSGRTQGWTFQVKVWGFGRFLWINVFPWEVRFVKIQYQQAS